MLEKEEIVGRLLKPVNDKKGSVLIEEIDTNNNNRNSSSSNGNSSGGTATNNDTNNNNDNIIKSNNNNDDEGPSILELMMAAQLEAKQIKDNEVKKEQKKFGSGFAKGFFNDSSSKKKDNSKSSKPTTTSSSNTKPNDDKKDKDTINVIKKKEDDGKLKDIIKDVKKAMDDDTNPLLKQLQQGDWVTDDLKTVFQSNKIVRDGFSNPKCMAAMELMKTNPNEAKKRFEGDPDVDQFMREFGKLMSDHFNKLGGSQSNNNQKTGVQEVREVQEVGPLQVEAMKRNKEINNKTVNNNDIKDTDVSNILNDPELAAMLMDVELQRILKECEDPLKFQYYMKDPIISKKIQKLWKAGLVGTAK